MSKMKLGLSVMLLLLLSICAPSPAEEGEKPPEKKPDTPPKTGETAPKSADPTQASSRLRQALRGPERSERVAPPPTIKIPEITLKGLLQAEGKPASAVLEVKGKGHVTVVAGSRILLTGNDNGALLVKKVGVDGVEIEVPGVKELLVVK